LRNSRKTDFFLKKSLGESQSVGIEASAPSIFD
jgi:hypothetical protein